MLASSPRSRYAIFVARTWDRLVEFTWVGSMMTKEKLLS